MAEGRAAKVELTKRYGEAPACPVNRRARAALLIFLFMVWEHRQNTKGCWFVFADKRRKTLIIPKLGKTIKSIKNGVNFDVY